MQDLNDIELLREYAERGSEAAFTTLVERHLNKVYSVALRHTNNPHQAEEITQAVFVILARKARRLSRGVILYSWLYKTARLTSLALIRSEIRRNRREQEAFMQNMDETREPEVWPQIAPLLDRALAALNETDRRALVLRFFYGKTMKEIGVDLDASEDAVKQRVNRALSKLQNYFQKRGVHSTTAMLAGTLSTCAVQVAPAVLAKSITAVALAKGATASASTATLINGALKVMVWTKAKTVIAITAGILFAAGTATVVVHELPPSKARLAAARDHYQKAMKYYMAGQYSAELPELDLALGYDPNFEDALFSRACLYDFDLPQRQRDKSKAIDDYTRCLRVNPRNCSARFNRALCYANLQPDRAIADYTVIISGDTDFSRLAEGRVKQVAMA
ncbi:MAG TPA: sigma-70 family RNA polymerase sigma factor, partial [Verrucomicrobiae bacterium]